MQSFWTQSVFSNFELFDFSNYDSFKSYGINSYLLLSLNRFISFAQLNYNNNYAHSFFGKDFKHLNTNKYMVLRS